MKQQIMHFIKKHYALYCLMGYGKKSLRKCLDPSKWGGVKIHNKGFGKVDVDNEGSDNVVVIGNDAFLNKTKIRIRGHHNKIEVGENCSIGKNCSFWMEGNYITIKIGAKTSFTQTVHFCAQEDNTSIIVGNDCLFSNTITVRTSDSHPIYSLESKERINKPKSVQIGNHVWVAPNTRIFKGAQIGDGAIIGSDSMVSSIPIPNDTLAVGHPARVVKEKVKWTREQLF